MRDLRARYEAHEPHEDLDALQTRIEALDWNRRVWTALASDCSDPSNQMAKPLRASIISLSLFVNRHSSEVMRGAEDFSTLIDITAVDHPERVQRFDMVWHLLSMYQNQRIRVKVAIREDEVVPSPQ